MGVVLLFVEALSVRNDAFSVGATVVWFLLSFIEN